MDDIHATRVARYVDAWNETDPARRRDLVGAVFTEHALYVDPRIEATGHAALDAMLGAVQDSFPGHRFRPAGQPEAHHDRLRFRWSLAAPGGAVIAEGTDVATYAADGRFLEVIGFLDAVAS